jgi:hypothetical protein
MVHHEFSLSIAQLKRYRCIKPDNRYTTIHRFRWLNTVSVPTAYSRNTLHLHSSTTLAAPCFSKHCQFLLSKLMLKHCRCKRLISMLEHSIYTALRLWPLPESPPHSSLCRHPKQACMVFAVISMLLNLTFQYPNETLFFPNTFLLLLI